MKIDIYVVTETKIKGEKKTIENYVHTYYGIQDKARAGSRVLIIINKTLRKH